METLFRQNIDALLRGLREIDERDLRAVAAAAAITAEAVAGGRGLFLCGNGGSAATASHVANDLLCHMKNWQRPGYPVICLNDSAAVITSLSNDYGFDQIFAKPLAALARPGDVLWAFSTSGNSANAVEAVRAAREMGVRSVAFTGAGGGKLREAADVWVPVRSDEVMRVEELHLVYAHCIAERVEAVVSPMAEA